MACMPQRQPEGALLSPGPGPLTHCLPPALPCPKLLRSYFDGSYHGGSRAGSYGGSYHWGGAWAGASARACARQRPFPCLATVAVAVLESSASAWPLPVPTPLPHACSDDVVRHRGTCARRPRLRTRASHVATLGAWPTRLVLPPAPTPPPLLLPGAFYEPPAPGGGFALARAAVAAAAKAQREAERRRQGQAQAGKHEEEKKKKGGGLGAKLKRILFGKSGT